MAYIKLFDFTINSSLDSNDNVTPIQNKYHTLFNLLFYHFSRILSAHHGT